jgi:tRNA pseudouridine38-40 synthase
VPSENEFQRYKLIVAYRGTAYHGWQRQAVPKTWKKPLPPKGRGLPTVQDTLRRALEHVVLHPVVAVGSSRTDGGVHAKAQVVHFDTDKRIPLDGFRRAINHQLPDDILVRHIEPVDQGFNAILHTTGKRYQYFIWHDEDRPLFFADLAWYRWRPLDIGAMKAAAKLLVGTHDFASFARPGHGRVNTVRTVLDCTVSYRKPKLIISVESRGFLWNMVRIIVGTLVDVGLGIFRPEDMVAMLEAKDRRSAGSTAPPHGLYLQWVRFEEMEKIAGAVTEENMYEFSD